MRHIFCLVIAFLLFVVCFSQETEATGRVVSATGFPISSVKVKSKVDKRSVYTDTIGSFHIPLHSPDILSFSYDGFTTKEIAVTTENFANIVITLTPEKSYIYDSENANQLNSQMIQNGVNAQNGVTNSIVYSKANSNQVYTGSSFPVFTHQEDTKGSIYLLDKWFNALIYGSDQNPMANSGYVYNYDKIAGSLVMTSDMQTAVVIDRNKVSRFALVPKNNDTLTFAFVPSINTKLYAQVLVENGKYSLYKVITTELKKANYHSTGMTSTGNPYDEYVDNYKYYISDKTTVKEMSLKQKSIREALSKESAKTDAYFNTHRSNKLGENDLVELIRSLNQ